MNYIKTKNSDLKKNHDNHSFVEISTRDIAYEEFLARMKEIERQAYGIHHNSVKSDNDIPIQFNSIEEMEKYYGCSNLDESLQEVHEKYGI